MRRARRSRRPSRGRCRRRKAPSCASATGESLPAIAGLTALALERVRGPVRAGGYALLAASCVANVVTVVYFICDRTNLSLVLFGRFTLG
jgi:hypothetical protein